MIIEWLLLTGLLVVAALGAGWLLGHRRGHVVGRREVLEDWWKATNPAPAPEPDPLAWLLDTPQPPLRTPPTSVPHTDPNG